MLIEEAGYKGKYINKIMATGYATNEIESFIKQRKRWAIGSLQLAKNYNILKEDAYKDVTDEIFKLEYKISRTEEELKDIDNQIRMAKDVRDFNKVEQLFNRKKQLQEDLDGLIEIYNDTSLSAKISGGITNLLSPKVKEQFGGMRKLFGMFSDAIIAKLPKKFSSVLELRKSLAKLENINKSVDELMTMQTPYGEAGDKYIKLSKYITRANTIQAEIAKTLR